jgi:hypothetical protein
MRYSALVTDYTRLHNWFDMKRALVSLLILTGIVLTLTAFSWLYFERRIANPAPVSIPDSLADLPLTYQMTGQQAAFDFSQLHGKQFPLTSGAVGVYGNQKATLWVAGPPLKRMATEMLIAMRDKLADGRSPFLPTGEITSNGQTVYALEGMGQNHYYFQSGNLVVWLSVETELAETALQQLKEYYP